MEFLKIVKRRRSLMNEVIYIALNIGLALALMILVRVTSTVWPALISVVLSMWRVFAVRPQFWFANLQANLVSAIVSISYVMFLYVVNVANINESSVVVLQLLLAILDACWLLFLKPRSKRVYVIAQAGVALFVGMTAIYAITYDWVATPVVLLVWLVGYGTSRHVLNSYDEENHVELFSMAYALFLAEIGWLAYHWTVAYRVAASVNLFLPQIALIATSLGFVCYKAYDSYYHHQKINMNDIILPLVFTVGIIAVLVLFFNGATTVSI